jgi:geranylgeranyl pyrophosphate synthase/uncharacterized protein with NAD-binding domain and iron-sulfur cluster
MRDRVVILGGGVAGMSAAHELIERGFKVDVYERRSIPGGKARSLSVSAGFTRASERGTPLGRTPSAKPSLPGEHGFRFFPGFYRHVIDTMSRIPFREGHVSDNLVDTSQVHLARYGRAPVLYPARFPQTPGELLTAIKFLVGLWTAELDVPPEETAYFAGKVFQIVSSCEERRQNEYEHVDWWDFTDAEERSLGYQKFFANGFTRSLVAAKAERASTKTIGDIFVQMILSAITPPKTADRLLNGPTNDVWIAPWLAYLQGRGVRYHFDSQVIGIECRRGNIQSVSIQCNGRTLRIEADHFVSALPVERLAELVTPEMERIDPALGKLAELAEYVEWMNGIQFYLTSDVRLAHGHSIYMDTPWALTSVSQAQFWPNFPVSQYGDGSVRGILSVCVSDWDVKGHNGKEAQHCTPTEIKEEVWRQLKQSLNVGGQTVLSDEMLHSWFLDPSIGAATPKLPDSLVNAEPLLVNYVDTWRLRPEASGGIPNFFLASDYVRTFTDIATMEAANEAARRAVNGILGASGSDAEPCAVWKLHEPEVFAPLRALDRARFEAGLPWEAPFMGSDGAALHVVDQVRGLTPIPTGIAEVIPDVNGPPGAPLDFGEQLDAYRDLVQPKLLATLGEREPREHLYDLIEEHLEHAGKGMRPALLMATTAAFGGSPERALPTAAALEMLHNAFLIHDDIEDGSEYRRGRPAMYVERGLPLALNAGDAMQALSIRMLRENVGTLGGPLSQVVFDEFERMLIESLEGQALELGWVKTNKCTINEDDYLTMVLKKTCYYSFIHPCRLGALIARGPGYPIDRFDALGALVGTAFQIQDDILNLIGDEGKYGKEIRGDLWEGKRTLILAHLLDHANSEERTGVESVLAKSRNERSERDVDWLDGLLSRYDSIDYARRFARTLATAAAQEFEVAFADAIDGPDKAFVRQLTSYALDRDK